LRVEGVGLRVEGVGLRVEGMGLRVEGVGLGRYLRHPGSQARGSRKSPP